MRKLIYLIAGLIPLLLFSCQTNDHDIDRVGRSITVNYSVLNSSITTYSTVDAINGEDRMSSLHILFFEPSSGGTGKFIEHYDASPPLGQTLGSWGTFKIELPVGTKLSATEDYNVLLIANIETYLDISIDDWLSNLTDMTQTEVIGTSLAYINDPESLTDDSTGRIESDNLPMSASTTKSANEDTINAQLVRAVSRIDVENLASGCTLVSTSIWNVFPRTPVWSTAFNDFSSDRITRLYGITSVQNNLIEGQLYSLENYVMSPAQNDRVSTCIILGLKDDASQVTTYYRVNLNAKAMGQQLKRNNVYRVTINNVYGEGAPTEKDAYEDSELHLDYKINGWDMDQQGNIQFDGDNILAIPTTNLHFTPLGGEIDLNIFTFGEGYLILARDVLPGGITASLTGNVLTVVAEPSEDTKEGMIELRFGNLIGTINVTQTGDQSEYLDLSVSSLETFDNEIGMRSTRIGVSSSGTWTAEIYNDGFVFDATGNKYLTGADGGTFHITTDSKNTLPGPRYAFALISLDSNTEISRVLVLSQSGEGGVHVTPNVGTLVFDPDGTPVTMSTFTVNTDGLPWEIVKTGVNASAFSVQEGANTFTVTAGLNPEMYELEANLRIRLLSDQTIYFDLPIRQTNYNLSLDPTSVATVPSEGGTTVQITVSSGAEWVATIQSENTNAVFTNNNGTSLTGQNGGTFRVTLPEASVPAVYPKATVTVKIPGTNVFRTLIINQERMATRALTVTSYQNNYGQLTITNNAYYTNYIRPFGEAMRTPKLFGLSGTVYTEPYTDFNTNSLPSNSTDIFVICVSDPSQTNCNTIYNWLHEDDKRVLVIWGDVYGRNNLSRLNTAGMGYYAGVVDDTVPPATNRTINPSSEYTVDNNKIMDYLLRSGPFTEGVEIAKSNIQLRAYDIYSTFATAWAPTFVPVIMHPTNSSRCLFGIDPANRMVFLGNVDLFSDAGAAANNFSGGTYSDYNYKFLLNVIAWITNVAQYGDEFASKFLD